jgi:hypothetical protein
MLIKKLYVVNDGADDLDMLVMSILMHPNDYKLVRAMCGDREVDVVWGYHEECLDVLEFEVVGRKRDLYDVAYDLYGVDGKGKADLFDMIFVAETDDGEYVEFGINDVRGWMWEEFVEELEELEEEDDGILDYEDELEGVAEVEVA